MASETDRIRGDLRPSLVAGWVKGHLLLETKGRAECPVSRRPPSREDRATASIHWGPWASTQPVDLRKPSFEPA
jgi:hypothetical protein